MKFFSNLYYFCFFCRNYIVIFVILVTFVIWINGNKVNNNSLIFEFAKNSSHWTNCTIDGATRYDDNCDPWIAKFLKWMGLGLFIIFFLICCCLWFCVCTICRIICCTERPREVIYTTYVYPASYTQLP